MEAFAKMSHGLGLPGEYDELTRHNAVGHSIR